LQKLYGCKVKEYVRKYEKVYDLLALPKAALKERERKEREEKRIREGKKPRKPRQSS
jgi:NDP-sugar pyrophosphorylase family protein